MSRNYNLRSRKDISIAKDEKEDDQLLQENIPSSRYNLRSRVTSSQPSMVCSQPPPRRKKKSVPKMASQPNPIVENEILADHTETNDHSPLFIKPCETKQCKTCKFDQLVCDNEFHSNLTNQNYFVSQNMTKTCTSSKLIYLISCSKCDIICNILVKLWHHWLKGSVLTDHT